MELEFKKEDTKLIVSFKNALIFEQNLWRLVINGTNVKEIKYFWKRASLLYNIYVI